MNPHPTAVYIERKPVVHDRSWSPAFSHRLPVEVQGETAPDTSVDYSAFHGVGRDITHAMPHMWRYQALAIASKLAVAEWPFKIRRTLGAMVIPGSSVGGQNPTFDRGRTIAPMPLSYAGRNGQYANPVTYSPQWAKLI